MAFATLLVEDRGAIRRITLNRPDKLNALNRQTLSELLEAFEAAAADEAVRVVVLTGAGPKAFVAGADIAEMNGLTPAQARDFSRHGQRLMSRIEQLGKPGKSLRRAGHQVEALGEAVEHLVEPGVDLVQGAEVAQQRGGGHDAQAAQLDHQQDRGLAGAGPVGRRVDHDQPGDADRGRGGEQRGHQIRAAPVGGRHRQHQHQRAKRNRRQEGQGNDAGGMELALHDAHGLCEAASRVIRQRYPQADVMVHADPV